MAMHFRESITVAVDALKSNKLRAVLTSIGVIIGSASIVLVVTVALTSQRFVISQIEAIGSKPRPTSGLASMETLTGGALSKSKLTKVCATGPGIQ